MKIPDDGYDVQELPETTPVARTGVGTVQSPAMTRERKPRFDWAIWLIRLAIPTLCVLHGMLIWIALGGMEGLSSDLPPLQADHGIHYRHGLLTREFLRTTGMSAGYDPGFMSGYPMSIVSDLSSTFSNLVMLASGDKPAVGYKLHVLGCAAAVPWLIAMACLCWGGRSTAILVAVILSLVYFWTDFPKQYVALGMLNYLLSVPVGLICVAGLTSYLERGGLFRWAIACGMASAVFLVHVTSPLIVGPAGLLAYAISVGLARRRGTSFPLSRHLGLWLMVPVILGANLFWVWPGYLLRSTKGVSDISFAHPEGVWKRVREIFWTEQPIQATLLGFGLLGLVVLSRRRPVVAAGLGGFLAAGFGWGYLAGAFRMLDSLQPGRQTYALYSAACIAAGFGLAEIFEKLRPARLGGWFGLALLLIGLPSFSPVFAGVLQAYVFSSRPFLSPKPTPRIAWVLDRVKTHVKAGERLLFEETGLGLPGLGDPYEMRHCSAVIPGMMGVELIGGPYLHSTITTNFTQFGENKLFEKTNWDREFFERYARIYRPSAICCWSPKARSFCAANPDLIQILDDDGVVLIGRVKGFEGAAIQGKAIVEASPNRLVIRDASVEAGSKEGSLVVLRYHAVPYLRATPSAAIKEMILEDDPVPFIAIEPTSGPLTIEMVLPPRN